MGSFMANVHPWFSSGTPISQAADWTWRFFQDFDVAPAALSKNKPDVYIAETGWPTESLNATEANNGAAGTQGDASVANLQSKLSSFYRYWNEKLIW
jgi:glucan 1,3-beta-glucosidase